MTEICSRKHTNPALQCYYSLWSLAEQIRTVVQTGHVGLLLYQIFRAESLWTYIERSVLLQHNCSNEILFILMSIFIHVCLIIYLKVGQGDSLNTITHTQTHRQAGTHVPTKACPHTHTHTYVFSYYASPTKIKPLALLAF